VEFFAARKKEGPEKSKNAHTLPKPVEGRGGFWITLLKGGGPIICAEKRANLIDEGKKNPWCDIS